MATDKKLSLGSWSEGSTRTEDIASSAIEMARSVGIWDETRPITDAAGAVEAQWLTGWLMHDEDTCTVCAVEPCGFVVDADPFEDLNTLIDALDEYAPIYCYVGMAEGDGANFGVWPAHDSIQDAIRNAHTLADGRLLNITDMVIIDVSDHGNVEVYAIERGASLLSLV